VGSNQEQANHLRSEKCKIRKDSKRRVDKKKSPKIGNETVKKKIFAYCKEQPLVRELTEIKEKRWEKRKIEKFEKIF